MERGRHTEIGEGLMSETHWPTEFEDDPPIGHAGPQGHVCGAEPAMRTFALAVQEATGAEHVYVFPEKTIVELADEFVRYRNGPKMREAIDQALLGIEVVPGEFDLLRWRDD